MLKLRDGEDDLLNDYRLRSIIQKYSDHISLPIVMPPERQTGDGTRTQPGRAGGQPGVGAVGAAQERAHASRTTADFYRHVAGDFTDPLAWVHSKIEGTYEYTLLLFIPSRAPYDLWMPQPGRGVKLHIRRVFVLEDNGQLMPQYLRFVRGVIDSSDLPLNISRELLQGSRVVDHIRSNAVKKVLKLLADLAGSEPGEVRRVLEGVRRHPQGGHGRRLLQPGRDRQAAALHLNQVRPATRRTSRSRDYVGRMKEGQEEIYYLLAPSLAAASRSPHLETFRKKGIEVLLLGEDVDNWVVSSLREFDGKRLQSVAQGTADLGAAGGRGGSRGQGAGQHRVRRAGRPSSRPSWRARPATSG